VGVHLVGAVGGFSWDETEGLWKVRGALRAGIERWMELERREEDEEQPVGR
jgi:hypothetical protein